MAAKQVYKNPVAGTPLLTSIGTEFRTPILEIKFSNLLNPYYFKNSPSIPRYSVTCIVDPELHKDFLQSIQTIEKNEKVESILKLEIEKSGEQHVTTGKLTMKFQCKDKIPVFITEDGLEAESLELEDELGRGEKVMVIYDIMRYTKKNTMKTEHGISFKPTKIFLYSKKED